MASHRYNPSDSPPLERERHAHPDPRRRRLPRVAHRDAVLEPRPRGPRRRRLPAPPRARRGRHGFAHADPRRACRSGSRRGRTSPARTIGYTEGDLCDWAVTERVFREFQPEAVVHYGEMPSAPYSMKDREHAVFTQTNNVVNTLNVIFAIEAFAPGRAPGEARHDGRVRHAEHRHRRGLHRDRAQGPDGHAAVPEAAGQLLPPVEGPRLAQHPLRVPHPRAARDRPEPGRRLRHRDRGDRARRAARRPGSTTTTCSAPRSTGSASRP